MIDRGRGRMQGRRATRVRHAGTWGAALVTLSLVTSACSSSGSGKSTDQTPGTSALSATTPAANGAIDNLTWNLPNGEPTTLDYVKAGDYGPDTMISQLCESLLTLNPDFTTSPGLAKSYDYSQDHLTLTFTLNSGVTFSDGKAMTSDDVVYSLMRNKTTAGSIGGSYFANVSNVTATGSDQVTVQFSEPDHLFLEMMATVYGDVAEKAYVEAKGDQYGTAGGGVMCTGPFTLQAWTPGKQMVLAQNPSYWNTAKAAHAKAVTVSFNSSASSLSAALASNEYQGAWEVPPSAIPQLSGRSAGKLYYGQSLAINEILGASTRTTPQIRNALNMVIDRAGIAKTVYHGAGQPNYTMLPPSSWGTDSAAKAVWQKAYDEQPHPTGSGSDIADAKKLLQGQDTSTTYVLGVLAGQDAQVTTATLIQQEAAQAGLKLQVKQIQPLDFSNLFYDSSKREGYDFVLCNGFLNIPDALDYYPLYVGKDALFNWTGFNDPQAVADMAQARTSFDPAEAATLMAKVQESWESHRDVIPILSLDGVLWMDKNISGATSSFAYIFRPGLAEVGAK